MPSNNTRNHGQDVSRMKTLRSWSVVVLLGLLCCGGALSATSSQEDKDRAALEQTSKAIRDAFARGDLATVMAYHHPDVVKALNFHTYQNGHDAVEAGLRGGFEQYRMEFVAHHVEYLLIRGDTAVEESVFTIRSTPKAGGSPVTFSGRAMVVYVRYPKSPSGWASMRELIQPATQ
jgi:ketosteroid isomerase-like protein